VNWLGTRLRQEVRQHDTASALAIEGLALEILAEASRNATGQEKSFPHWLKDVQDFLHENFAESFALEDVAKIAGVHPAHLSRVFRQKLGCTVGDYIRRLRVESACRQIMSTDVPLSVIASNAGFSDQSHFNKVFKTFLNLTPYEYRKMSRAR
jgi:AraC family transcriptional regulator